MTDHGERGSVTVFVVGVVLALVVMGGLVFDGGAVIAGHREADAEAEGAARAAAEQVSIPALRSGQIQLNAAGATQAADAYLRHYGRTGTVVVTGDEVTVTVSYPVEMQVLDVIGIRSKTVTGTGTATAIEGAVP
jgi:beta-lactam-binding protein with PASTA domain